MKKIALATAALLLASGAAFAENPNFGWDSSLPATGTHAASTVISSNPGTHPADEYNSQLNTGR